MKVSRHLLAIAACLSTAPVVALGADFNLITSASAMPAGQAQPDQYKELAAGYKALKKSILGQGATVYINAADLAKAAKLSSDVLRGLALLIDASAKHFGKLSSSVPNAMPQGVQGMAPVAVNILPQLFSSFELFFSEEEAERAVALNELKAFLGSDLPLSPYVTNLPKNLGALDQPSKQILTQIFMQLQPAIAQAFAQLVKAKGTTIPVA